MPDLTAGRFRYEDRYSVLAAIEQAVADLSVPDAPDGAVSVIVRVTAPQMDEPTPEQARGCATAVTG